MTKPIVPEIRQLVINKALQGPDGNEISQIFIVVMIYFGNDAYYCLLSPTESGKWLRLDQRHFVVWALAISKNQATSKDRQIPN
jgi:hypothetical protein